jgi:hypothetical protein
MTHDELSVRVVWLVSKVVELLNAIAIGFSMFMGWQVANFATGEPGWRWDWQIVFGVTTTVIAASHGVC